MIDLVADAYRRPDPRPYVFEVGQPGRVRLVVAEDGQTPPWWAGARVRVTGRRTTGLHKDHWYKVRADDGRTCEFREDELDRRFARTRGGGP